MKGWSEDQCIESQKTKKSSRGKIQKSAKDASKAKHL